jgi:hypothetical protein
VVLFEPLQDWFTILLFIHQSKEIVLKSEGKGVTFPEEN